MPDSVGHPCPLATARRQA